MLDATSRFYAHSFIIIVLHSARRWFSTCQTFGTFTTELRGQSKCVVLGQVLTDVEANVHCFLDMHNIEHLRYGCSALVERLNFVGWWRLYSYFSGCRSDICIYSDATYARNIILRKG